MDLSAILGPLLQQGGGAVQQIGNLANGVLGAVAPLGAAENTANPILSAMGMQAPEADPDEGGRLGNLMALQSLMQPRESTGSSFRDAMQLLIPVLIARQQGPKMAAEEAQKKQTQAVQTVTALLGLGVKQAQIQKLLTEAGMAEQSKALMDEAAGRVRAGGKGKIKTTPKGVTVEEIFGTTGTTSTAKNAIAIQALEERLGRPATAEEKLGVITQAEKQSPLSQMANSLAKVIPGLDPEQAARAKFLAGMGLGVNPKTGETNVLKDKAVIRGAQERLQQLPITKSNIATLREALVKNPDALNLKGTVQQFKQELGETWVSTLQQAQRDARLANAKLPASDKIRLERFSPELVGLAEAAMGTLSYNLAKMLDPGGRLTDRDVEIARKSITGGGVSFLGPSGRLAVSTIDNFLLPHLKDIEEASKATLNEATAAFGLNPIKNPAEFDIPESLRIAVDALDADLEAKGIPEAIRDIKIQEFIKSRGGR